MKWLKCICFAFWAKILPDFSYCQLKVKSCLNSTINKEIERVLQCATEAMSNIISNRGNTGSESCWRSFTGGKWFSTNNIIKDQCHCLSKCSCCRTKWTLCDLGYHHMDLESVRQQYGNELTCGHCQKIDCFQGGKGIFQELETCSPERNTNGRLIRWAYWW